MSEVPSVNPNPPLSLEQIATGIKTVWENAVALLEDARFLFKNGRFARSVSLCILAQEEVSKVPLIIQLLYVSKDGEDPLSVFCGKFVSHRRKTIEFMTMHVLDDVLNKDGKHTETITSGAKTQPRGWTFAEARARGFYVEFDRNKKEFSSPRDAISQQMAADFLANVEKHLSIYQAMGTTSIPEIVQLLKRLIEGLGDEAVRSQMEAEAQKVQAALRA